MAYSLGTSARQTIPSGLLFFFASLVINIASSRTETKASVEAVQCINHRCSRIEQPVIVRGLSLVQDILYWGFLHDCLSLGQRTSDPPSISVGGQQSEQLRCEVDWNLRKLVLPHSFSNCPDGVVGSTLQNSSGKMGPNLRRIKKTLAYRLQLFHRLQVWRSDDLVVTMLVDNGVPEIAVTLQVILVVADYSGVLGGTFFGLEASSTRL